MSYRPLGFVSYPTHVVPTKHAAFTINSPDQHRSATVTAPGHIWVIEIVRVSFAGSADGYQIRFQPCRDVLAYFNHLGSLSAPLRAAFEAGQPACETNTFNGDIATKCRLGTRVELTSGAPIGVSDGFAGVDFGAVDFAAPETRFANNKDYDNEYLHTIAPTQLFTPAALAELTPHIASLDGSRRRTAQPLGGTHNQDVAGTAQGNWFPPGGSMRTVQDERQFLALVHDLVDPGQPEFSFGDTVPGISGGLASFAPRQDGTINRDFAAVVADGRVYCWENFQTGVTPSGINAARVEGTIFIAMPDAVTLRIEHIRTPGAACGDSSPMLSAAAVTFGR